MDTPLPQLLAELGVDVTTTSQIIDPTFTGATALRPDGSLLLVRPQARPALEWDMLARAMLGRAFGVALPDLPTPYELTEV
ncbi:hypothetical protein [Streptomyces sp. NRRL S-813]|uniref:hypothetical protein n=1 Tax=Streptomyces sp. NRRL S-813 TaxID=1463919 RepID=UPI000A81E396|nr:hypothetical protein [Streptomyces sp. NRRL S-813]